MRVRIGYHAAARRSPSEPPLQQPSHRAWIDARPFLAAVGWLRAESRVTSTRIQKGRRRSGARFTLARASLSSRVDLFRLQLLLRTRALHLYSAHEMRAAAMITLLVSIVFVNGQNAPMLPQLANQEGQLAGGISPGNGGGGFYSNNYYQPPAGSPPQTPGAFQSAANGAANWANGAASDFKQGVGNMAQGLRGAGESFANVGDQLANAPRNLMDNVSQQTFLVSTAFVCSSAIRFRRPSTALSTRASTSSKVCNRKFPSASDLSSAPPWRSSVDPAPLRSKSGTSWSNVSSRLVSASRTSSNSIRQEFKAAATKKNFDCRALPMRLSRRPTAAAEICNCVLFTHHSIMYTLRISINCESACVVK